MLNLGMSELLIFAIIAVIVLGPDKLPTAIRSVIKWYRQVKMLVTNVQRDIERELEITEIREKMEQEIARFKEIEHQMQAQLDQIQKEVDQLEKPDSKTEPAQISEPAPSPVILTKNRETGNRETSNNHSSTVPVQKQSVEQDIPKPETHDSEQHSIDQHHIDHHKKVVTA